MAIEERELLPQTDGELVLLYASCGCGCGEWINVREHEYIYSHADKAHYVDRLCMANAHNAEYFPMQGKIKLEDGEVVDIWWFMGAIEAEERNRDESA